MIVLRAFFRKHHYFAVLLLFCAVSVRALVPTGYMIGPSSKTLSVQICSDGLSAKMTQQITIPMEQGSHDKSGSGHQRMEGTCAFSSLAMAGIAGADPVQLALALAFILLIGFARATFAVPLPSSHLRPPLRGPPVAA